MPDLVSRRYLAALRILLGVIFLAAWASNLSQGFYTPEGFRGFLQPLAQDHPLGLYRAFLEGVAIPAAAVFAPFQLVAELLIGLALLSGTLTRLAGAGALLFFANLFLAYLNPSAGEWIWTYVMLLALAAVVTLGAAGRAWGVDRWLWHKYGEPKVPIY